MVMCPGLSSAPDPDGHREGRVLSPEREWSGRGHQQELLPLVGGWEGGGRSKPLTVPPGDWAGCLHTHTPHWETASR